MDGGTYAWDWSRFGEGGWAWHDSETWYGSTSSGSGLTVISSTWTGSSAAWTGESSGSGENGSGSGTESWSDSYSYVYDPDAQPPTPEHTVAWSGGSGANIWTRRYGSMLEDVVVGYSTIPGSIAGMQVTPPTGLALSAPFAQLPSLNLQGRQIVDEQRAAAEAAQAAAQEGSDSASGSAAAPVEMENAWLAGLSGFFGGLVTGAKAIVNASADAGAQIVSLGQWDPDDVWTVDPATDIGYDASRFFADVGVNALSAAATGGMASAAGKVGQVANVLDKMDMGANLITGAQGAINAVENGEINLQNGGQMAIGLIGGIQASAWLRNSGVDDLAPGTSTIGTRNVGAAERVPRVLQTGGHTITNRTRNALGLTKEQAKRAMEELKHEWGLPPNWHHARILDNGDVLDSNKSRLLGNLFDYL